MKYPMDEDVRNLLSAAIYIIYIEVFHTNKGYAGKYTDSTKTFPALKEKIFESTKTRKTKTKDKNLDFLTSYEHVHATMPGEGKCTFGTRMPIDIHMLNEIIYREVKNFRNYKIYRPNFGSIPVTGKFYAAHEQQHSETEEQTKKIDHYHHNVTQSRANGPHSKYPSAATENMVYGWYTKPLVKMDRNDKRFYYPKKESSHTKVEIIILMSNPQKKK